MKKRILILLVAFGVLGLVACGNSKENEMASSQIKTDSEIQSQVEEDTKYQSEAESFLDSEVASKEEGQESYTIAYKDIVFDNGYKRLWMWDMELQCNKIRTTYENASKECLYAFYLATYYDGEKEPVEKQKELALELALENGLMVLADYPYCVFQLDEDGKRIGDTFGLCTVAGTMEDIKRVFEDTPAMKDYYWVVAVAPRPDWADVMFQLGWDGEEEIWQDASFYKEHEEQIIDLIGIDSQVTISVPVILPKEETSESN